MSTMTESALANFVLPADLKIILLGDSAVGKTRALSLYRHTATHPNTGNPLQIDFYDTAGQERFASMHAAYYYGAHACLLCFDLTRKETYKNLENWYRELRRYRPLIPVVVLANKVDLNEEMAQRDFKFALDNNLTLLFVSACKGTNVEKAFQDVISRAVKYKEGGERDFMDDVIDLLRE